MYDNKLITITIYNIFLNITLPFPLKMSSNIFPPFVPNFHIKYIILAFLSQEKKWKIFGNIKTLHKFLKVANFVYK